MATSIRPVFSSASFARTRDFFQRLGFAVREEGEVLVVAEEGAEIVYLDLSPPEGEPLPEAEFRNETCVILVDDVMAWHARIAESGQRFRSMSPPSYRGEPRVDAWDRPATAITDPDGNLIWFLQQG